MTVEQELLQLIPKDQIDTVLGQEWCDIDLSFLGFVTTYKYLSMLIPKNFTVIDLGCAYNPQCYYFKDHKRYIAVDASKCLKFKAANCDIFEMTIHQFIENYKQQFDVNETFVICNYVPTWYDSADFSIYLSGFKNVYSFYPSCSDTVKIKKPAFKIDLTK